jgi:hypothetical protein
MSSVRTRLMSQYRNYMEERILIDERIDRILLSWIGEWSYCSRT